MKSVLICGTPYSPASPPEDLWWLIERLLDCLDATTTVVGSARQFLAQDDGLRRAIDSVDDALTALRRTS